MIEIRPLTNKDLPRIAEIHLRAFPESALTRFGLEAVRRYYEWQLIGPHQGAPIGAWVDGTLQGYCFGGVFKGAMSGFLTRNRKYLILRVLTRPWLVFNPLVRERIRLALRILLPRKRSSGTPVAPIPAPAFGILAIAVDPACQGKGVGRRLMEVSEQCCREMGFQRMRLSVSVKNLGAIRFYELLGWVKFDPDHWEGAMERSI